MFDLRHPFFLPLWRRVLVVVLLAGWTLMELMNETYTWAALVFAMAGYTAYQFFVVWNPEEWDE
ncbi:MAG: hypothetical protein CSA74_10260 [Rhodobacterales bacterium]|nr:MAG: hypothetical protein CSA74_10260 [Rhodobacterales bacterium]